MDRRHAPLPALLAVLLGACGASGAQSPAATHAPTVAPTPGATHVSTSAPLPTPTTAAAVCLAGPDQIWVAVDAKANLFGAGLDRPPAPAGGGSGVVPPVIELPAGASRLITFPCTAGQTDFAAGIPTLGPDGFVGTQTTNVESFGGVSGLVMEGRVMFLAGLFTADLPPGEPAPERLDFTGKADFELLKPDIGQTFFIGGGAGKTFVAPARATRLYLGFVDALFFTGQPGWYGNNRGALEATVAITVE